MSKDQHNLTQGEKFKRMTVANKALRERTESKPPKNGKVHIPSEDIEAMRALTPIVLTNEPLPERAKPTSTVNNQSVESKQDDWEWVKEYAGVLFESFLRVLVFLIVASLWAYALTVVIGLFFPRVELTFFQSGLIAIGIGTIILIKVWWSHKSKPSNKDDE